MSVGTFLLRWSMSTSISVESSLFIFGLCVVGSRSSSSFTGDMVMLPLVVVDISILIASLIWVAIDFAISEICDEIAVVMASLISFIMSTRMSRIRLSTSLYHVWSSGTGSFKLVFSHPEECGVTTECVKDAFVAVGHGSIL